MADERNTPVKVTLSPGTLRLSAAIVQAGSAVTGIVPRKAMAEIARVLGAGEEVRLAITDSSLVHTSSLAQNLSANSDRMSVDERTVAHSSSVRRIAATIARYISVRIVAAAHDGQ